MKRISDLYMVSREASEYSMQVRKKEYEKFQLLLSNKMK